MAFSNPLSSRRSFVPALLALLCLAAAGCSVELVDDAVEASCAGSSCAEDQAPSGDTCDDGDPCTADADCTPCSALPPSERSDGRCTPDDELPAFCEGKTGCVHAPMTTPAGQVDSCFPVAGDADLHAGACRAGVCVENAQRGAEDAG
jgi:hypothetical protein